MAYRRKINIFLGSSLVEFATERSIIENFIRNISDKFEEHYDVKVQPLLCENFDDAVSSVRKQEEYNQKVRSSELCFFIFFTKAGDYTKEEFEVAMSQFRETGKPKIYTYFKVIEDGAGEASLYAFMEELDKTLGHYYGTFHHVDTVKLRILLSLKLEEMDFLEIKTESGKCVVDGHPVVDLKHVTEFVNNRELARLQVELQTIESQYFAMKAEYETKQNDRVFFSQYSKIASKRASLMEQIEEMEKLIFEVSLRMVKDSVRGEITVRQKEAYRLFELGDYEGCMAVLDSNEMDSEFQREERRDAARRIARRRTYIREYKTKIEILTAMIQYNERFDEIGACYEKIVPYALEEKIELDTVYAYVSFLTDQNKNPIEWMKKLEKVYDDHEELVSPVQRADLYNLMGVVYSHQQVTNKAEGYYQKAIKIREKLATENPDRYNAGLAMSYNNAGVFYKNQGDVGKAEEYYQKAMSLYEKLATENPDRYNAGLATSYFNFAIFKNDNDYFEKAYKLAKASPHHPVSRQIIERLKNRFK